jgi:hypothetical protein
MRGIFFTFTQKKDMITFAKVKSVTIEGLERLVKVLQFGIKETNEAAPFGFDSCPVENDTAIYCDTSNQNDSVIVGYIRKSAKANPGESRIYCTDLQGNENAFIFLRDSKIELNGAAYTAVRGEKLKNAIDANNNLINAELVKIQMAITMLGGVYAQTNVSVNFADVQSENVKLE